MHDEKEFTQSFDWGIWKRLAPFLKNYRRDFVGMLAFNGLCALVDVLLPLLQQYAIRNFIQKGVTTGLLPYALVYTAMIILQGLSVMWFCNNSMRIEMYFGRDLKQRLFHHLQTLSFSFYNVTPVGYLLSRIRSRCDIQIAVPVFSNRTLCIAAPSFQQAVCAAAGTGRAAIRRRLGTVGLFALALQKGRADAVGERLPRQLLV